jgi:N-carbamoylputrescine amidase
LGVVLPCSYFEKAGQAFFNSVAMIDAGGRVLGNYRKSHIPQGPGYEEKFYFSPGDTGYKVWETAVGKIGVGICWDQWFPECARSMALMGAEMLLYPTAIGSEPPAPGYDSQPHWEICMRGHAGSNIMPVIASNRIGREVAPGGRDVTFYGSSFISDHTGQLVAKAGRDAEEVLVASFDLDAIADLRAAWGLFRDRRPETYGAVAGMDGR